MLQTLFELVEDGILTISEVAKRADMTEKSLRKIWRNLMHNDKMGLS
jgi:transposase-like protein